MSVTYLRQRGLQSDGLWRPAVVPPLDSLGGHIISNKKKKNPKQNTASKISIVSPSVTAIVSPHYLQFLPVPDRSILLKVKSKPVEMQVN